MPLTPTEVRHATFNTPPAGEPGYHQGEVDDFLDLVAAELIRLSEQNNDLLTQLEQLDQQLRAVPADTGGNPGPSQCPELEATPLRSPIRQQTSPGADHNLEAATILVLAQETTDQLTGEVNAETDGVLNQVRANCAQLLSHAYEQAQDMINEARTRAKAMLHNARTAAETVERQSRDKAALLERDATRKHAEILDALNQDKSLLENTINRLRAFEQHYRSQLTTYVQSQLHKLDGPGLTVSPDPISTEQGLEGSELGVHGETGNPCPHQDERQQVVM